MKNLIKKLEEISAEQLHNQKQARSAKYNSENVEVLANLEASLKSIHDTMSRFDNLMEYMKSGSPSMPKMSDMERKKAIQRIDFHVSRLGDAALLADEYIKAIRAGDWNW